MHTQTITIRYICVYMYAYLSIYGGSRCETKVRTLKGIRHYCCSVSVCVGSLYRVSRSHSVHVTWFTICDKLLSSNTHPTLLPMIRNWF